MDVHSYSDLDSSTNLALFRELRYRKGLERVLANEFLEKILQ